MIQAKSVRYRLTPDDVIAIRANREGLSDREWGRRLGVHKNTIAKARSGETWGAADIEKAYAKKKPKKMYATQEKAITMKAGELCNLIEGSKLVRSGQRFSADDLVRSMSQLKFVGLQRVKVLLARMADDCKLDKIRDAEDGHEVVYYCKRSDARGLLSRPWVNFSTQEYTPRWY